MADWFLIGRGEMLIRHQRKTELGLSVGYTKKSIHFDLFIFVFCVLLKTCSDSSSNQPAASGTFRYTKGIMPARLTECFAVKLPDQPILEWLCLKIA